MAHLAVQGIDPATGVATVWQEPVSDASYSGNAAVDQRGCRA
jgi:hypothetical protein